MDVLCRSRVWERGSDASVLPFACCWKGFEHANDRASGSRTREDQYIFEY